MADRATRATAMTTVVGLVLLAGYTSYSHMRALAERVGERGADAHAFPLTVDGLDLIGVLVLLADRRTGRNSGWLPWTVLTIGTLASIAANVAVAPANPIARAISGWSAVALLAAAKMLAHLLEPPATSADTVARLDDTRHHDGTLGVAAAASAATPVAALHDPTRAPATARIDTFALASADATEPQQPQPALRDAARRLPTSDAARNRWRDIWHATRHLDHATADAAATHGVSLRTLQFIRAAGQAGHLPAPPSPPNGADTLPAADEPSLVTQRLQSVP
jgi:hypothetical protein